MADYFVEKWKDYAHSKQLLKSLNQYFEDKDLGMFKQKAFKQTFEDAATIRRSFQSKPHMEIWDVTTFMKLNNACAAALTKNTAGIAEKLAIFS